MHELSPDPDRRFTDRELGLVLKRAAEMEEQRSQDATGRGLTLRELHDIGREVGLSPEMLNAAVAELQGGARTYSMALLGPPTSTKVVHAVPGRLSKESMQQLVQVIEDRVAATGTVTEALGAVRWTSVPSGTRVNRTTQVVFTPSGEETQIQVANNFAARFRRIVNLVPTLWGIMAGFVVASTTGLGVVSAIGVTGGCAAVGYLAGRAVWRNLTRRARARVDHLATEIAELAKGLAVREPSK